MKATLDDETAAYLRGWFDRERKGIAAWQRLTDEEISAARHGNKTDFLFAREIERILMEKNR